MTAFRELMQRQSLDLLEMTYDDAQPRDTRPPAFLVRGFLGTILVNPGRSGTLQDAVTKAVHAFPDELPPLEPIERWLLKAPGRAFIISRDENLQHPLVSREFYHDSFIIYENDCSPKDNYERALEDIGL